jgi:hypothetical protein
MINYLASRLVRTSKHVDGRRGQKAASKRHRRGEHGKAVRRRRLAASRLSQASKKSALEARSEP